MILENKLGIASDIELAREEERLTKLRALELYDTGLLGTFEVGTFAGLAKIHGYLFQDVYEFAGEPRTVNISKGSFRFASVMYLGSALRAIDKMPQSTFDQIVEKYVEMNVAHPFRGGATDGALASGSTACSNVSLAWSLIGARWIEKTTCLPWSGVPCAIGR